MLTRFHSLRLSAAILLIVAVVCGCGLPKVGKAQDARKGATVQAQGADAALALAEMLKPCDRLIPSRTKLYGVFAPSEEYCLYIFQGVSGEVVTVRASSLNGADSPTVTLLAPRGAELITGTAAAGTVGNLIDGYRLRESGLHTIHIQKNSADSSQFQIALAGNTRCGGKISPETVITAQLSESARYCVYSFIGRADARWQVETQKLDDGVAPDVDLFDPQGISLAYTQNTGPGRMQTYQLPFDGSYTVLVNAARMVDVGSFELALLSATKPDAALADTGLFAPGQQVRNVYLLQDNRVNLRRTPGHVDKPANDILLDMPGDAVMVILGIAVTEDHLPWWPVRYTDAATVTYTGWVAEVTEGGYTILAADE